MSAPVPPAIRKAAMAVAALACLVAAGCMLLPGRFQSTLDLRRDGTFTFAYTGEMHVLALGKLARLGEENGQFAPTACHDEKADVRDCTAAEVAAQKDAWEEGRRQGAERRKRDAEQMKGLLGGLDLSDPRAADELATRLRKQAGWRKVEHRGEGLFDVDFRITGRLDRDFQFPTLERMPNMGGFVLVSVRNDGTVRIDAPAFGPLMGGEPLVSLMGMGAARAASNEGRADAGLPVTEGTFTMTTDGEVLANNTDEGPQADPAGRRMTWQVNRRSVSAPMAIVRIAG